MPVSSLPPPSQTDGHAADIPSPPSWLVQAGGVEENSVKHSVQSSLGAVPFCLGTQNPMVFHIHGFFDEFAALDLVAPQIYSASPYLHSMTSL